MVAELRSGLYHLEYIRIKEKALSTRQRFFMCRDERGREKRALQARLFDFKLCISSCRNEPDRSHNRIQVEVPCV